MIWVAALGVAALVMAPLASVLAGRLRLRGRRDPALALHRAQLAELDRDRAEGRIGAAEHATAVLEVQRRLLAEAEAPDAGPVREGSGRLALLLALGLVPAAAIGLYLVNGQPGMPSVPFASRTPEQRRAQESEALVANLRQVLMRQDPHTERARQGWMLLGRIEAGRGRLDVAAAAWRMALEGGFDPDLAFRTAEAETIVTGRVGDAQAELFRRALAAAPADAPWRAMAEQRLAEAGP